MRTTEELEETLASFPQRSPNPEELARLWHFLNTMKAAGVATTRGYDLPLPDTLGRARLETRRRST